MMCERLQAKRAGRATFTLSFAAFERHVYLVESPPEPEVRIHMLAVAARALSSFEAMISTCATSLEKLASSLERPSYRIAPANWADGR